MHWVHYDLQHTMASDKIMQHECVLRPKTYAHIVGSLRRNSEFFVKTRWANFICLLHSDSQFFSFPFRFADGYQSQHSCYDTIFDTIGHNDTLVYHRQRHISSTMILKVSYLSTCSILKVSLVLTCAVPHDTKVSLVSRSTLSHDTKVSCVSIHVVSDDIKKYHMYQPARY